MRAPEIVAELSANHLGDYRRAVQIAEAAAAAGADLFKVQVWQPDTMCINTKFVLDSGPWSGRRLIDLYREAWTPWEWLPTLFASANGNAFGAGVPVAAFAKGGILGPQGGLLTRPTIFPMANGGIGLGGEAGTEAVMPLVRGRGGKLGVQAQGGGGSIVVNYAPTIHVDSRTDQAAVTQLVGSAVQQSQRQLLEHLKSNGVLQ